MCWAAHYKCSHRCEFGVHCGQAAKNSPGGADLLCLTLAAATNSLVPAAAPLFQVARLWPQACYFIGLDFTTCNLQAFITCTLSNMKKHTVFCLGAGKSTLVGLIMQKTSTCSPKLFPLGEASQPSNVFRRIVKVKRVEKALWESKEHKIQLVIRYLGKTWVLSAQPGALRVG